MTSTLIACKTCGQVHVWEPLKPGEVAKCSRCGVIIARRSHHSLHLTAAFSLAALLLYWPANVFPILRMQMYGMESTNTIWEGCVRLYQDHDYVVAIVVFLASIVIPLLKLLGLFFLSISSKFHFARGKLQRTWIYIVIEAVGRWAMLDVFVLATLVSLVKLRSLATIIPGNGLLAFTLVVICTILASANFDPQLIWEKQESHL